MNHVCEVQTDRGTHQVEMEHYHEHLTVADFERILLQEVLRVIGQVAVHRYTYRGRR